MTFAGWFVHLGSGFFLEAAAIRGWSWPRSWSRRFFFDLGLWLVLGFAWEMILQGLVARFLFHSWDPTPDPLAALSFSLGAFGAIVVARIKTWRKGGR